MFKKIVTAVFLLLVFTISAQGALAEENCIYMQSNIKGKKYVMRLDLNEGKLEKFFRYEEPYMRFSMGENGRLYFSTTGGFDYLSRELFVVDPGKKKKAGKIKIRGQSTLKNFVVGNKLFVVNEFSDRPDLGDNSSIEIYDAATLEYKNTIYFPHKDQRLERQLCLNKDKTKIYIVDWSGGDIKRDGEGRIYRIDVEKEEIDQSFGPYNCFAGAQDIAVDKRGKIYIAASYREPGNLNPGSPGDTREKVFEKFNREVLVFSPVLGRLINRIRTGQPEGLVYVSSVDKLYVQCWLARGMSLDVIDCSKQKKIARIANILINDMAYGGDGKLVMTFKDLGDKKEYVGILDVHTDKFIKKIELESYGKRISFKPYAE